MQLQTTNDLVKEIEGELRVSHRDIAENLDVNQKNVSEMISKYKSDFEEFGVVPFQTEKPKTALGGRPENTFYLNEHQATLFFSYAKNTQKAREFKKRLVKIFYQMRDHIKSQQLSMPNFNDPAAAARAWAEQYERTQEAHKQIEADKPRVSYAKAVEATVNSCSIRDWITTQKLPSHIKQKDVYEWLDNRYTYKGKDGKRRAYAEFLNNGVFEHNIIVTGGSNGAKERIQVKITGEGQVWLANRLQKWLEKGAA